MNDSDDYEGPTLTDIAVALALICAVVMLALAYY